MHIRAKSHMVSRPVNRPGDLTRPKTVRDRSKTSLSVNHAEKAIKKKSTKHASKHARALPTHALESIDPALTRKVSGPSSRVDHHPVNMPLTAQNVFSIHTEAYMFLESVNPDLAESQILFTSAAKQAGPRSLRSGYMVASIECDIKLPPAYVDLKHHAVIYSRLRLNTAKRERGVFIIDRSIKGTWLNGKRLVENEETELNEGDIVSFRGENGENEISYVVHLPKLKKSLFTSIKDRYTIKKYIENGSFGEVSKARCNVTRRIVALKKFYTCNPNQKKYLKQEISTYLSLRDHPCIIRLEEVLEYNDDFYLVMEFGEDGDLFQYVSNLKVPLSEDEVKIIFDQIFYAVESLHDQGVAHRDLKLENILVMSKKTLQIKLADFGLAKFESERNFTTMCGTKSYVAPEILYEPRSYDKSVDIWSLGVMLYCTIARKFPFDKLSPEILWSLQKAPERFFTDICFDGISRECKDLIIKLLTPDSTKRPTIKDVLKHPWLEHIETQRTELKGLQRCPELMDYIRQREASGILSPALTP